MHVETDASGRFTLPLASASASVRANIGVAASRVNSGQSTPHVDHEISLAAGASRTNVTIDIVENVPPFSETFYRELRRTD